MADLHARGKSRRYIGDLRVKLARAADAFSGQAIADITTDDIDSWLRSMAGISGRSRNNYRAALATLFSFARSKGYLPRGQQTEAQFATRYQDKGSPIGIYTPAELRVLLTNIEKRFVPFVAIGAFAGLRSAEICRLDWSDIRWEHNDIELERHQAKTGNRRLAPLLDVLRAWLTPFRKESGPVLGVRENLRSPEGFARRLTPSSMPTESRSGSSATDCDILSSATERR